MLLINSCNNLNNMDLLKFFTQIELDYIYSKCLF